MHVRLYSVCVRGDYGCVSYERRLSSSEVMSCAGCSISVISRHLVVIIVVSLFGMYAMSESDSLRRGRDHRVRSM